MTAKILPIFFVFVVLLSPVNIFAQSVTVVTPTAPASKSTIKDTIKTNREAAKERMTAAREAFKEKMVTIKDARKKAIVENIDSKIQAINERRMKQMGEYLVKLTGIVERLSTKEAALKSQGKDTTKLLSNITAANTAISQAQTAVDIQSEKDYSASITTDELLKSAVNTIVTQFRTDIKAVFELVKTARRAVLAASTEAKQLALPKPESSATQSATTPTGLAE